MVVDFYVPDVTNSSVVDIVRGSAGTTFNIEHLGCGCDVKALHDDEVLFKKWRSVYTLRCSRDTLVGLLLLPQAGVSAPAILTMFPMYR